MCASAVFIVVVKLDIWWLFISSLHIVPYSPPLARKPDFLMWLWVPERLGELG